METVTPPKQPKKSVFSSYRLTRKQKRIWLSIIAVLLLLSLIAGLVGFGYNRSYENGRQSDERPELNNQSPQTQNLFSSFTGMVTENKDKKLSVQSAQGEKVVVTLNDQTKIIKESTILTSKDITKDQKVTIFTQGSDDGLVASRVVFRD